MGAWVVVKALDWVFGVLEPCDSKDALSMRGRPFAG